MTPRELALRLLALRERQRNLTWESGFFYAKGNIEAAKRASLDCLRLEPQIAELRREVRRVRLEGVGC